MNKWLLSCYLLCCTVFCLPVLAETCPQIWTSAVQGTSAVPASVSYSPSSPTSISSLNTTLSAADYQLSNGTVANNTTLTASGPTVRIFFNGSLSIGNNVNLNALGNAENLLIVATGSISIGNNAVIKGFLLAGGSVQIGTGSQVTGAITAKGSAANFGTVNYDTTALSLLQGGVVCGAALECFNDTFQDAALSSSWVTSRSSGTFTPSPVNGRLRLTQAVTNQATAASFQRLFPGAQNLVTVEFDHLVVVKYFRTLT